MTAVGAAPRAGPVPTPSGSPGHVLLPLGPPGSPPPSGWVLCPVKAAGAARGREARERLVLHAARAGEEPRALRTVVHRSTGGRRLTAFGRVPFLASALHLAVPEGWASLLTIGRYRPISPGALGLRMAAAELRDLLCRPWRPRRLRDLAVRVRTLGPGPGLRHFLREPFLVDYRDWVARHDTLTPSDRDAARAWIAGWPDAPTVAVVVPAGAGPGLAATRTSLAEQLYPHVRAYAGAPAA